MEKILTKVLLLEIAKDGSYFRVTPKENDSNCLKPKEAWYNPDSQEGRILSRLRESFAAEQSGPICPEEFYDIVGGAWRGENWQRQSVQQHINGLRRSGLFGILITRYNVGYYISSRVILLRRDVVVPAPSPNNQASGVETTRCLNSRLMGAKKREHELALVLGTFKGLFKNGKFLKPEARSLAAELLHVGYRDVWVASALGITRQAVYALRRNAGLEKRTVQKRTKKRHKKTQQEQILSLFSSNIKLSFSASEVQSRTKIKPASCYTVLSLLTRKGKLNKSGKHKWGLP